ncbi:MAG: lipoprotein-releasing ABC transporter ATP-binding protein LolD [Gammaproteobacteria bacterium]|jgi:lipoprotein-releasing system ATP-binding protein
MNSYVLSCENLSKTYDDGRLYVEVLKGVNLAVQKGEMLAILGPSGSGKSSLLHLLGGLDEPSHGDVYVAGQNLKKLSATEKGKLRNRYLGFVYQFHHLLPEFTALENVAIPLLIRKENREEALEKARIILCDVGLKERTEHRIGELSGGERQRVAIARALVTRPSAVLADEPTGNLDHKTATQIYDLICKLNQDYQVSFVIVTHDLAWTTRFNRVLKLEGGVLQEV